MSKKDIRKKFKTRYSTGHWLKKYFKTRTTKRKYKLYEEVPIIKRWDKGSSIIIEIKAEDVILMPTYGDCEEKVRIISQIPYIRSQIDKWDPEELLIELKKHMIWTNTEFNNHEENIQNMLWLICGDLEFDMR